MNSRLRQIMMSFGTCKFYYYNCISNKLRFEHNLEQRNLARKVLLVATSWAFYTLKFSCVNPIYCELFLIHCLPFNYYYYYYYFRILILSTFVERIYKRLLLIYNIAVPVGHVHLFPIFLFKERNPVDWAHD